jgi:peptidoglycan/LPS O-acetylase OafA/YrhL
MFVIVIAIISIRSSIVLVDGYIKDDLMFNLITDMNRYLAQARFNALIIGGMGAYLLFYKKANILNIIYNRYVQVIVYGITITSIIWGGVPYFASEFYAVLFCIIILNVSSNPNTLVKFEHKSISYLGKISYGIYMYHPIAIVICLVSLNHLFENNFESMGSNILLYILSIALTIIFAAASYHLFEKKFLRLKDRYRKIITQDEPQISDNIKDNDSKEE